MYIDFLKFFFNVRITDGDDDDDVYGDAHRRHQRLVLVSRRLRLRRPLENLCDDTVDTSPPRGTLLSSTRAYFVFPS